MSIADDQNTLSSVSEKEEQLLFSQLEPQHIETFYQHYQQWQRQQHIATLQAQIAVVEQHIVANGVLMNQTQPSPIALATLTRLQSCGVDDVDLLDALLEHGDTWLDHTLQQLEQCERLDFIHDNYTQWCRNALDGAYNWLDSMSDAEVLRETQLKPINQEETLVSPDTTEVLLLQKLMSEEEATKPTSLETDEAASLSIPIPTRLSYASPEISTANTPSRTLMVLAPAPVKSPKPPRLGLMSRIMANVWRT